MYFKKINKTILHVFLVGVFVVHTLHGTFFVLCS